MSDLRSCDRGPQCKRNLCVKPEGQGATAGREAREISGTKQTASYDIRVSDQDGRLIATCQALAFRTGKPLPFL